MPCDLTNDSSLLYNLTCKQKTMHPIQVKILNVIQAENLGPLSLRKLGSLVGESLPQKILHHLKQLENKGFIRYDKDSKSIELLKKSKPLPSNLITIPIKGAANCGEATALAEDRTEGYIQVSSGFLHNFNEGIFALKASGDSMDKANIDGKNIEDGDYVLVDSRYKDPKNNDYVVSIIDGMANIKKFSRDDKNQQVVLISESSKDYPPIFIGLEEIENYLICGRVMNVIKKPIF